MDSTKYVISTVIDTADIDPNIALLFTSSVKQKTSSDRRRPNSSIGKENQISNDQESSGTHDSINHRKNNIEFHDLGKNTSNKELACLDETTESNISNIELKRKRKRNIDDIEDDYMLKLAFQEEEEITQQKSERITKIQKIEESTEKIKDYVPTNLNGKEVEQSRPKKVTVSSHKSIEKSKQDFELDKASRTVFLGNVSTVAISSKKAKKTLIAHMSSFFPNLQSPPEGIPPHKVKSIRFRSTAYTGSSLPKRTAFAKKDLMSETTKSTNAYLVYSNHFAAREAVKRLNGSIVLDRHLRVDGIAHPSKTDHKRCVFVGNLGFVDDESLLSKTSNVLSKISKTPSDIEEGLWRQFSKAGSVENVRVVRDPKNRVGKGFAYVQFTDQNSVEAALLFNDKKYPPMLPRRLRVVRAKPIDKTAMARAASSAKKKRDKSTESVFFNSKLSSEESSLHGRAAKLFGRAGAAKIKQSKSDSVNGTHIINHEEAHTIFGENLERAYGNKTQDMANPLVFEGNRATAKINGLRHLKLSKRGKVYDSKPKTRSSRRASEWRKNGNKKG